LRRKPDLALAGAATLFGSTFIVMQDAVKDVDPLAFLVARFGIGAVLLLPFLLRARSHHLFRHGALAGLTLAVGYVGQTVGLQYTTTSVSAFFTYLLVVIVPLMTAVVFRRLPTRSTLAGIVLAVAGLFVMSGTGFALGKGEVLTLLGAVAFAAHIVVLSEVAGRHDVFALNAVQFSTVALLLAGPALVTGSFAFTGGAWAAAVYTGVVVSVIAFGLQVWGQSRVSASRAALVLMLEPVVAAIIGRVDGEHLGAAGAIGAGMILAGILVCELAGPLLDRSPPAGQPDPLC
jgi:drug/metabolite transporter (DMT)-like permease